MHPSPDEFIKLQDWYKETFAFDDGGSIAYYFHEHLRREDCFCVRNEQNEIVSMLCAHLHTFHFQDRNFPILMINGVITKESARGQGWMKRLFEEVFRAFPTLPFYALQAYEPLIYQSLGFVKTTFVKWEVMTLPPLKDILEEIQSADDLADCASCWLSRLDGWMDHDRVFYEDQIKEAAVMKQPILGFYEKGSLCAFARCRIEQDMVWIEEYCACSIEKEKQLFQMLHKRYPHLMVARPCTEAEANAECTLLIRANPHTMNDKNILAQLFGHGKDVSRPLYHYGWW